MPKKRKFQATNPHDFAIQDFFEDFIAEKMFSGLSSATIKSYRKSFDRFVNFLGSNVPLNEIDKDTIVAFVRSLKEDELTDSSINHYVRDIRVYLNFLMEHNYLDNFDIKTIKCQETEIEVYSLEEMDILLAKPKTGASYAEWRSWCIINWIYATGNRASTIINIKIGDLDLEGRRCRLAHTKNKKAQYTALSTAVVKAIETYLNMWLPTAGDDEYLFQSYTLGNPQLTYNALRLSIAKYNKDRGINKTSIHAFRHTFAREWILNGGDVFKLQRMLGHSSLEMTKHYVTLFDADLQKDLDTFNPLDTARAKYTRTSAHTKKTAKHN